MSIFTTLNAINVNDKTERKNGLTYLSWAWAWGEVKKLYPEAQYTVYENTDGWNYFTDGRTGWVKTGVTIDGLEHIEYLPIMDYKNKSIKLELITSFDVNKAIQRSLTKAIARHGLGLYIYAGEDLPEEDPKKADAEPVEMGFDEMKPEDKQPAPICEVCGKPIPPMSFKVKGEVKEYTPQEWAKNSIKKLGVVMCNDCMKAADAK